MSTVVEVLARLKADASNFTRGTRAASRAAKELTREAREADQALSSLGREAQESGAKAAVASRGFRSLARSVSDVNRESRQCSVGLGSMRGGLAKVALASAGVLAAGPPLLNFMQSLTGLLGLVPALASAGAISIGVLVIGLQGFGEAVKNSADPEKFAAALRNLSPAAQSAARAIAAAAPTLRGFRAIVQEGLFTGMSGNIQAAIGMLAPLAAGFQRVGQSIAAIVTDLTKFWASSRGLAIWQTLLTNTAGMLDRMRGGIVALTSALGTLAAGGSSSLLTVADRFTALMERFDRFAQRVTADGSLKRWISNGLNAFTTLAGVIRSVAGIFGAITRASRTAADGMNTSFSGALKSFTTFLNSAKGQQFLVDLFTRAQKAVEILGAALKNLLPVFAFFKPLGDVILGVLGALANCKTVVVALGVAFGLLRAAALLGLGPLGTIILGVVLALKYAYDHSERFRTALQTVGQVAKRVMGLVASSILGAIATGIRAYRAFASVVLGVYEGLAQGAAKALGWIPGIGDKVKGAANAISGFRDTTLSALDAAAKGADALGQHLDDATRARTAIVTIVTQEIKSGTGATDNNSLYGRGGTNATRGLTTPAGRNYGYRPTPPPKAPSIPGVGGYGFGKTPTPAAPKAQPVKAVAPALANIPIVNNAKAIATAIRDIGKAFANAGKAVTAEFLTPVQQAQRELDAAMAAAQAAQAAFNGEAMNSARADKAAADARARYLNAHQRTVNALKASGGRMTANIKILEQQEAAAKRAASAAASAATQQAAAALKAAEDVAASADQILAARQALAQAVAEEQMEAARQAQQAAQEAAEEAARVAQEAADALREAQEAIAAAARAVRVKVAQKALAQVEKAFDAARTKFEDLSGAISSGIAGLTDFASSWDELKKAQEEAAASVPDPRENVYALREAIDLARELGTTVDEITTMRDQNATVKPPVDFVKAMQQQADEALQTAQRFLSRLDGLRANGASTSLIDKITSMGPKAGTEYADALLNSGRGAISSISRTLDGLKTAGTSGAKAFANSVYGPLLDENMAALKAMEAQFADVFDEITDSVDTLVESLRDLRSGTGASIALSGTTGSGGTFTFGDISITVPEVAGGVTPADIEAAVRRALEAILSEMSVR